MIRLTTAQPLAPPSIEGSGSLAQRVRLLERARLDGDLGEGIVWISPYRTLLMSVPNRPGLRRRRLPVDPLYPL